MKSILPIAAAALVMAAAPAFAQGTPSTPAPTTSSGSTTSSGTTAPAPTDSGKADTKSDTGKETKPASGQ